MHALSLLQLRWLACKLVSCQARPRYGMLQTQDDLRCIAGEAMFTSTSKDAVHAIGVFCFLSLLPDIPMCTMMMAAHLSSSLLLTSVPHEGLCTS